ncbi:peptidyl-tRNA hydrolase, mitochondrial-like [Mangifera indica]|uniref:peptidyl-tRNA hydrolase, mitochondrial-like n=1 Tax=Mangifera indica TaxID=29780 RepID=UPI001CFB06DE|nr:peptidyl-tRNA hydrolase, mitochondrial-like [Mangifera indica]
MELAFGHSHTTLVYNLCFPYRRHSFSFSPSFSLKPKIFMSLFSSKSTSASSSSIRNFFSSTSDYSPDLPETPKQNQQQQHPWLIVGLGNPGKEYNGTRHNVGFEMIDALADAEGIYMSSVNFRALLGKGFIGNVPVMLAKPQTFVNSSGESVGAIVSYYKIPLKQVLVIFDDLDLPFSKLRLLPKGGHGGQNGMRNIIDHFKGNRDFPRLRIGIGRPPGKMDTVNYVLGPFNQQECEELDFIFQRCVEAIRILLLEGFDKSAQFVNGAKSIKLT